MAKKTITPEQTTVWTWDLQTEADPMLRLGIHGLYRLLTVEGSDRYPTVKQTPELSWETDGVSRISLRFDRYEVLNALTEAQLGDHREGISIPAGYPDDPTSSEFGASIIAHNAASIFGAMKGQRRFSSISEKDFKEKHGASPLLGIAIEGSKFTLDVSSPHQNSTSPVKAPENENDVDLRSIHHIRYNEYNKRTIKAASAKDKFVLSLAYLSMIFLKYKEGDEKGEYMAFGLDMPDFQEQASKFSEWFIREIVHTVRGNHILAAWMVRSVLDLPCRSYICQTKGFSFVSSTTLGDIETSGSGVEKIHEILRRSIPGALSQRDKLYFRSNLYLPGFYESIIRNLEYNHLWYLNVEVPLLQETKGGKKAPLELYQRRTLTSVMEALMTETENSIAKKMNSLTRAIIEKTDETRGRSFISSLLNKAATSKGIFEGLCKIQNEAGYNESGYAVALWTKEELAYLVDQAHKSPSTLRSFLLLCCNTIFIHKKTESNNNTSTDNTSTNNTESTETE